MTAQAPQSKPRRAFPHGAIGHALNGAARLAPRAASRMALALMLRPPRRRLPVEHRRLLAGARARDVEYVHGRVRVYDLAGDGQRPVLLAHGWGGSTLHFAPWVEALPERGYRPLLLDLPAHGASSGRETSGPRIAAALLAVEGELGPFAGIVAHSFAGFASLIAAREGLRTDRLVLINSPTEPDFFVRSMSETLGLHEPVVDGLRAEVEAYLGRPFGEFDATTFAAELGAAALLIHDEHDRQSPVEQCRRLAAAWPAAETRYTRGLGHNRILGDRDVIATACRFLSTTRTGPPQASAPTSASSHSRKARTPGASATASGLTSQ